MSAAPTLDSLDAGRGGSFNYRWQGETYPLVDPAGMSYELVLTHLALRTMLGVPNMPLWKREALFEAWVAHYDLPVLADAQRLAYVVNRYRDDLDYDLRVHAQVDLGEAWRSRRWRTLLATIDRLPPHTYYAEAVSKDPEHARLLAESLANAEEAAEAKSAAPPLRTWTPEVRLLTQIKDGIRHLEWTVAAVQLGKKAGDAPQPSPTPNSLVEQEAKRADHQRRMAAHKALTKRLLPHKRD